MNQPVVCNTKLASVVSSVQFSYIILLNVGVNSASVDMTVDIKQYNIIVFQMMA